VRQLGANSDAGAYFPAGANGRPGRNGGNHGLPPDVTDFTGRGEALRTLDSILAQPGPDRPLAAVIEGMPGAGKTALTVHWANRARPDYPDGQLYINLRGQSDQAALTQDEALGQLLILLGMPGPQIPAAGALRRAAYQRRIAGHRLLIVLDNAAGEGQVRGLIPRAPGPLAVITSRNHLRDFARQPRSLTIKLGVLSPDEAVDLLTVIIGERRAADEPGAVKGLAEVCGYLPLALRIAAANLAADPHAPISDAVTDLETDRLSALTLQHDPAITVRTALGQSYRSLDRLLQRVFRLLGLFAGHDITADAAAALFGAYPEEAESLLTRLRLANLLESSGTGRYRLHDLLHEYAAELAANDQEDLRDQAAGRLLTWYLTTAQETGEFLGQRRRSLAADPQVPRAAADPQDREHRLAWFETERQNLTAAARQAAAAGEHRLAWELADALYDFLSLRSYSSDNLEVHRIGLSAARAAGHLPAQIYMRHHLSMIYRGLGQYPAAAREAGESLALSRKLADVYLGSAVRHNLAQIEYLTGNYGKSLRTAQGALRLRQDIGDLLGEAQTRNLIGRTLQALGRYPEALSSAQQALATRQQIGDRFGEGETLDALARLHRMSGAYSPALECGLQALAIRRELGDRAGEGESLQSLARVYRRQGNYPQAQEYARRALAIMVAVGHARGIAEAHATLGDIYLDSSRDADARRSYESALATRTEIGDQRGIADSQLSLARAYRRSGDHERSLEFARQARDISAAIGDRFGWARALDSEARAYQLMGQYARAAGCAQQALEITRAIGDRRGEGDALDNLSRICHRSGQQEKALEFAGRAFGILDGIGDRRGRAKALDSIARVSLDLARPEAAIDAARRAAETWAELGDRHSMAGTLEVLIRIARAGAPSRAGVPPGPDGPDSPPRAARPRRRARRAGSPHQRVLHSLADGFGGIFDLFGTGRALPPPLPSFEETLAGDVHQVCAAFGLVPGGGPGSPAPGGPS
jgi:tetratricopeptide (TPR) repeat protein